MAQDCRSCGWLDEYEGCNAWGIYGYDIPNIIDFIGCNGWDNKDEFSKKVEEKNINAAKAMGFLR